MNLPRVAIVYLSYNSRAYLPDVFDSITKLNYPKEKLELIVVDNASTDGSVEWLHKQKGITFFPNEKNTGFAEGNNLGMNHALLAGYDYIYLLNADAKFHPDALQEVVKCAESDETIGAVQSRLMLWKKPELVNSTGGMIHFLGFGFVRDNGTLWSKIAEQYNAVVEIAYPSGASVLYRASVLKQVGLLDPFLFLYHEDLELGWRIRLIGQKNVMCPTSIVYHDYEFSRSIQKFYWMERNRVLVHVSHLKLRSLMLLLPFMVCMEFGLFLFALKGGWVKEKFLVYFDLMRPRTWMYVRKKRKESLLLRDVSDKEIVKLWTGKIEHQETTNMLVEKLINPILNTCWQLLKPFI